MRELRKQLSPYTWLLFSVFMAGVLCDTVSQSKNPSWKEGLCWETVHRAGSQRLIQLGERIRQKRKDSHLSQETFAEKAGISVNTVSRIEGGQAAMSVEIFAKLVEVLDTDADELLGRRAKEKENDPVETTAARIRRLKPKEQKIVLKTMKALMDGMEGKDGWKVPQI